MSEPKPFGVPVALADHSADTGAVEGLDCGADKHCGLQHIDTIDVTVGGTVQIAVDRPELCTIADAIDDFRRAVERGWSPNKKRDWGGRDFSGTG